MQAPGGDRLSRPLEAFQGFIEHRVGAERDVLLEYPVAIRMDDEGSILIVEIEVPTLAEANLPYPTEKVVAQQIDTAGHDGRHLTIGAENRRGEHHHRPGMFLGGEKGFRNLRRFRLQGPSQVLLEGTAGGATIRFFLHRRQHPALRRKKDQAVVEQQLVVPLQLEEPAGRLPVGKDFGRNHLRHGLQMIPGRANLAVDLRGESGDQGELLAGDRGLQFLPEELE